MSDRHENKNWEFRQSKKVNDQTFRLYRNKENPLIFKRVANRTGCTSHQWEAVDYAMKGTENRYGQLTWVRNLKQVSEIPSMVAQHEAILVNLES